MKVNVSAKKTEITAVQFLQSVYRGDLESVNVVLNSPKVEQFLKSKDQSGNNALFIATRKGHEEIVRRILQKGGSLKEIDQRGYTLLHIAAEHGHLAIIKLLLQYSDVSLQATPSNQLSNLKKLGNFVGELIKGEEGDKRHYYHTPLLVAVEKGHQPIVEYLLNKGASLKDRDSQGNTPLLLAATLGHFELVRWCLDQGASLQEENQAGLTAIDLAERHNHLELLQFLQTGLYNALTYIPYQELTFGRKLGEGGSGIVYQGYWGISTDVAIKKIRTFGDELLPEFVEEFKRETKILSSLRHPNIINFYGIALKGPELCMVLEYLPKGNLHDVLHQAFKPAWPQRVQLSLDIAQGLWYLHKKHILHRDLKSLNVLVTNDHRAKLIDFGLAKVKEQITARLDTIGIGTPRYIAPELLCEEKGRFTRKTDIFAFGILMWEVAACKDPLSDVSNVFLIGKYLLEGKRDEIPEGTPSQYAALIKRCWAQRAEERPVTEDVVRELHSLHQNSFADQDINRVLPMTTLSSASI